MHFMLVGIGTASSAFAISSILMGFETALMLSAAIAAVLAASIIAFRAPTAAIVTAIVLGQITGHEYLRLIPESLRTPSFGSVTLRHSDLIFIGISVALALRVLLGDAPRLVQVVRQQGVLVLLVTSLGVAVARGATEDGIVSALGEFRTYYQCLLLVPFIALSVRGDTQRWRLFRSLIALSLLMIPLALVRGGLEGFPLFGSGAGGGPRWFNAAGGLAMVSGLVAVLVSQRLKLLRVSNAQLAALGAATLALVLVNPHRSVWLAATVAAAGLLLSGVFTVRRQFSIAAIGVLVAGAIAIGAPNFTDESTSVIAERASVFFEPESDPTASWRTYLWSQAMARVNESPLLGVGLGRHFQLIGISGDVITTSPHNFYITLLFHAGWVGLLFYAMFALGSLSILVMAYRQHQNGWRCRGIVLTAGIVLVALSAFFVAYSSEFAHLPWSFIGLGLASAIPSGSCRAASASCGKRLVP